MARLKAAILLLRLGGMRVKSQVRIFKLQFKMLSENAISHRGRVQDLEAQGEIEEEITGMIDLRGMKEEIETEMMAGETTEIEITLEMTRLKEKLI